VEYRPSLDLDPSSIPAGETRWQRWTFGLLPYYAMAEPVRGGVEIGYLPTLHFGSRLGVVMTASPLSFSRNPNVLGARAGLGLLWKDPLLINWMGGNSVDFGPYTKLAYNTREPRLGVEASARFAYNHIRGTLFVEPEQWVLEDVDPGTTVGFRLGVSNLNGLLYWAARLATE
jgi:hypothetical protein